MITEPSVVELGPFSSPDAVLTPWPVAEDALRRSQKYWLTSVRPDGRPHVTPLLATLALDGLCFTTGAGERKSKNLKQNPHVVLTTGVNTLTGTDLVIEGVASLRTDPDELASAARSFEAAFGWHLTDPEGNWYRMGERIRSGAAELWRVLPRRGFANSDGKAFSQSRYLWQDRP